MLTGNKLILKFKLFTMITIEVNERTKAGKALLEAARIMAQKNEGIEITVENSVLIAKIKRNHKNQTNHSGYKNGLMGQR